VVKYKGGLDAPMKPFPEVKKLEHLIVGLIQFSVGHGVESAYRRHSGRKREYHQFDLMKRFKTEADRNK
jgi:hypothetical protein